jgi:acyl-CoA synthetase (AMP-forming)/AMP-acid ligase II
VSERSRSTLDDIHNHTYGDVLRTLRRSHPRGIATVCGSQRSTYPELDNRTNRLANALRARGIEQDDRILWLGQNCHRLLEVFLAAAKLGAVVCPANWRLRPSEVAFIAADVSPAAIFWQSGLATEVIEAVRDVVPETAVWFEYAGADVNEYEEVLAAADDDDPETYVDAHLPLIQMYTAAFEGSPNGALISHTAAFVHGLAYARWAGIDERYVYLNCGPMFHIATLAHTLMTFQLGGTNVFVTKADPEAICEAIDRERCTAAWLIEPTISAIVELNRDGRYDLSSFRPERRERDEWHAMTQDEPLPGLSGSYGQTELIGRLSWPNRGLVGANGRPDGTMQVRLLDDDGKEVADGEVGEISVRGPGVMLGYYNRPEVNAARMRGGWYRTNDLGRREADGSITFVGVKARMIKSGLENVYPAEVEACLRRHPGIAEAAIIGVPDPVWAQSVKAIVVTERDVQLSEAEVIAFCRDQLASYKKPRAVEFVDALPRTPGGVDYEVLDSEFGGGGYPGSDLFREYSGR